MNSREEKGGQGEECGDHSGSELNWGFEKVRRSEEKWRDALVKMGQKKEKEGGQERSG